MYIYTSDIYWFGVNAITKGPMHWQLLQYKIELMKAHSIDQIHIGIRKQSYLVIYGRGQWKKTFSERKRSFFIDLSPHIVSPFSSRVKKGTADFRCLLVWQIGSLHSMLTFTLLWWGFSSFSNMSPCDYDEYWKVCGADNSSF